MLRKKLITLACITVLAMGISSQASADLIINVTWGATDTGLIDETSASPIWQYVYNFTYEGCTDAFCDPLDFVSIWPSFDEALSILEAAAFDSLGGAWDATFSFFEDQVFLDRVPGSGLGDILPPLGMIEVGLLVAMFDPFSITDPTFDIFSFDTLIDFGQDAVFGGDLGIPVRDDSLTFDFPINPVPEPGTLTLLGIGLLGLGAARRRRIV